MRVPSVGTYGHYCLALRVARQARDWLRAARRMDRHNLPRQAGECRQYAASDMKTARYLWAVVRWEIVS